MSVSSTGNAAHDAVVNAAEVVRQAAVAAATTPAAARTAEITFYRACLASSIARNPGTIAIHRSALLELGTGGV